MAPPVPVSVGQDALPEQYIGIDDPFELNWAPLIPLPVEIPGAKVSVCPSTVYD
jgi:hypothetical protein